MQESKEKQNMLLFFAKIYYLLLENYTLWVENDANVWQEIVNIMYLSVWTEPLKKLKIKTVHARVFTVFISHQSMLNHPLGMMWGYFITAWLKHSANSAIIKQNKKKTNLNYV